jgi:hypothetical protein
MNPHILDIASTTTHFIATGDHHVFHIASLVGQYSLAALMGAAGVGPAWIRARHRRWTAALAWLTVGALTAALTFTAFAVTPDYSQPLTRAIDHQLS